MGPVAYARISEPVSTQPQTTEDVLTDNNKADDNNSSRRGFTRIHGTLLRRRNYKVRVTSDA